MTRWLVSPLIPPRPRRQHPRWQVLAVGVFSGLCWAAIVWGFLAVTHD